MLRPDARKKDNYQTYPDGSAKVLSIRDRRITGTKQENMHFAEATVGERRFWDAQVAGVEITSAILVPEWSAVDVGDLVVIDGKQYEVRQKDRKDTRPRSWLLSLSLAVIQYREV